jgi:transketolase
MRDAFMQRLTSLAATDSRVMLLTGDLGFGVFDEFEQCFPKQFLNVGVAEQNLIGVATGLALEGRIPFLYSLANFPTLRCLEQIRNDACYHEANVKIVAMGGGFSYGSLGMSHHATEDLSILRALPQITMIAPGDDWEAGEATAALVNTPGTCYLRLDKSSAGFTQMPHESFCVGKARKLRDGQDITLITTGGILSVVLEASDLLAEQGINCAVVSAHTIKPFDRDAVFSAVNTTGGIVTIEEHTVEGGLGSIVAEICLDNHCIPSIFYRMGLRDGFSSIVGSQDYLRTRYGMDASSIVSKVTKLMRLAE